MNKALLVALREYMENLKTKAFWIGIMAFPVILILSFAVPVWLEKEKDVRHYAVYDQSGWLGDAVVKRSSLVDLEKVYDYTLEKYKEGGRSYEKLPDILKKLAPRWARMEEELGEERADQAMREFAAVTTKLSGPEGFQIMEMIRNTPSDELAAMMAGLGAENVDPHQVRESLDAMKEIIDWWQNLSPDEAEAFASGLSKSRYELIDVDLSEWNPEARLREMVNGDQLFAYFVIGDDPMEGSAGCKYVSNNLTDTDLKDWFSYHATAEVRSRRIVQADIDPRVAQKIQESLNFDTKQVTEEGEEEEVEKEDMVRQWAPVAFVYLLWLSVFMISQMLMTNTIEEKSNKIIEILLSSVSPIQLMAGKIIGIAGTGLTMVVSWVVFFFICLKVMPLVMGQGPDIDFALIARDPIYITSFLCYFILGYLLLSAILVGIGSVCNSLKEAQNLMAPVTIILIVPLIAMVPIGRDPNGTIAKVLSYVPPFTPFVMMNRAAGPPTFMEYVVTSILLIVSIVLALWAAAKIFRIGILMTGKPPKLGEILRWLRAPVGQVHVRDDTFDKQA